VRTEEFDQSRQLSRIAEDPSGQILAIIGLGDIGLAIAQRASAFGMHIHYFSPTRKPQSEATLHTKITYHSNLDSILSIADCICIACPYNPQTHHMFNVRAFHLMKSGVRIVNIARGPLIDEDALVAAMDMGKVIGVGLDVHENEPHVHPRLRENYMVTLLPHIGVCSKASWRNFESNCIRNLEAFFHGDGKPVTPVLTRK
jgi:lactate dehydrogenase-like 2-hydroxyacid dehydrogenase